MDIVLSGIVDQIPDDLVAVKDLLPEDFQLPDEIVIPAEIDLQSMLPFLLMFAAGALSIGFVIRMIMGKRSGLNHCVSSAMGILLIYAVTVVIYTFQPWNLKQLLSPLPFVTFNEEFLVLFPFHTADYPAICSQVLSMVILSFLVNLLDSFIPKGEKLLSWYILRFLTVVLAMLLHWIVVWACDRFLPDVLVAYAPVILLAVVVGSVLVGFISILVGLAVSVVNPFLGGVSAFLFQSVVGKHLTKAVFTTAILTALFFLLDHFGFTVILITQSALIAYIPLVVALLVLWYLLGHIL